MRDSARIQFRISFRSLSRLAYVSSLTLGLVQLAKGQVATTTQLTIPSPSIAVGVPTLLTASVTDSASHNVHLGTVTFYDGIRSLGSAQIVSGSSGAHPQGTANLKTASFSLGTNSITAVFAGTTSDLKSTSTAKTVTVTGKSSTTTTLGGFVTGTDFWLPSTLKAFGAGTPTGSVDFVHVSNGATIGSKSLTGAKWKTDLSVSSKSAVGNEPVGVATGDFNGDGFADLATTNFEQQAMPKSVSVLLGNGDGSFQPQVTYSYAAGYPYDIHSADFNNDGKLDLAVVNLEGRVGIMLGNGDGTFQAVVEYGSISNPDVAYVGDLDRDGNLDIVMGGNGYGPIAALLGKGDGTFQTQKTYMAAAFDLAGGDLNGDGIPDLVLTTENGNPDQREIVLLGKGDGTFLDPKMAHLDSIEVYVTLADLNGDGKLDEVLSNISTTGAEKSTISVAFGKGDGTFETAHNYPISTGDPDRALIVDIDHDGIVDIVLNSSQDDSIQVFLGNGDGTFQSEVSYVPNTAFGSLVTADFNGDGLPDLAMAESTPNRVETILNGETTSLVLAKENLGPGTTTVTATYSSDAVFAGSVSGKVVLSSSGTPPPNYATGFVDTSALQFNGSAFDSGSSSRGIYLTSDETNQAGSIFYGAPQNVQAFTTDFQFQIHHMPTADGLTFTVQNDSPYAVGGVGGGLGYSHISKSVAVKFDLYNNSGEGNNSTGVYINGEAPDVPAIDLTSSGINLHSATNLGVDANGHIFDVHITYDGSDLTLKLTDTVTLATFSDSWPIDIPGTVGGNFAYVGFTGATGGLVSTQQIYAWTYTPGTP